MRRIVFAKPGWDASGRPVPLTSERPAREEEEEECSPAQPWEPPLPPPSPGPERVPKEEDPGPDA